ncbi:MAG: M23 family metallopeptidase [Deltaproteobacteria bacterium]
MEITDVTGQGDTLYSLLSSNLVRRSSVTRVAASLVSQIKQHLDEPFDKNTPLKAGTRFNITLDRNGNLLKATVELDAAHVFHAVCEDGKVRAWQEDVVLDFKPETICFTVDNNLIESVLKTGEGMELALKLTNVFRWDIDFQSESVKGDVCKILFERRYADDRPSGYGRILCAVYEGKKTAKKTAVLFNDTYYDDTGKELKKNFLRSGAPTGTSVYSVAGGTVTFSGWKGGYGRYVCIRHETGYESRYGHLRRIFVRKGQHVTQRQRIGLVGQTGLATGPHLDFQLLVKGHHVDPLRVKMVKVIRRIPTPLKGRFVSVARQRLSRLGSLVLTQRMENFSLSSVR